MATKKTLTTTSGLDPNIELVGGNGGVEPPATYAGDETSQTFRTMAGKSYCLTLTTGSLTVAGHDAPEYTPDGITLLNASKAGQYIFIAISSYTTVNVGLNTQYVLTPLDFKVASLGASSGGGGDSSEEDKDMATFLNYVRARGFANNSTNQSFLIEGLPTSSNMKVKLNPRRSSYNDGAKIQIPQAIVQYLQIAVDQGDGTVKYETPTLVGSNYEITPKKGMSIEMTCLCSANIASVCTCVGFNDYDVMGDAYFLSAI